MISDSSGRMGSSRHLRVDNYIVRMSQYPDPSCAVLDLDLSGPSNANSYFSLLRSVLLSCILPFLGPHVLAGFC